MFTVLIRVVGPGIFELKLIVIPSCGWMRKVRTFGGVAAGALLGEEQQRGPLEMDGDLGGPPREALARAQEERAPLPIARSPGTRAGRRMFP